MSAPIVGPPSAAWRGSPPPRLTVASPQSQDVVPQTLRARSAGRDATPNHVTDLERPVVELMSRNLVTAHEAMKVSDIRKLMSEHGIHHVPVVSGRRFIGLISANDILRVTPDLYRQDAQDIDAMLDAMSVRTVMQEDVLTLPSSATVRKAAETLHRGAFHCVPIVEGEELLGLLTSTDLIGIMLGDSDA